MPIGFGTVSQPPSVPRHDSETTGDRPNGTGGTESPGHLKKDTRNLASQVDQLISALKDPKRRGMLDEPPFVRATDELGFHAVENRHYLTDIHATVLHQPRMDPRRLEVPERKRLEVDFGNPILEIIA